MKRLQPLLNSLRFKLFAIIFLIIVPLISVLLFNNHYAVKVVRNGAAQTNVNLLSLYMGQIDRNLGQVDNYLYDLTGLNTDLLYLEKTEPAFEIDYIKAKIRLYNLISRDIDYYKFIDLFFIYSTASEELILNQNYGRSYDERQTVKAVVLRMLQGNTEAYENNRWYIWKDGDAFYLYHLIKIGKVYVGAWVNAEKLMVPLTLIDFGESGAALLSTDKLEPMNHADLIREEGILLKISSEPYYLSEGRSKYLVVREPSTKGNFNLIAIIPDAVILEKLPFLQRIISVISMIAVLFLLLFMFFMRRVFLQPIYRIIAAMRKIRDGYWEVNLSAAPASTEFEIMNETFNRMIAEIRDLKINVYEEKLKHQQAELRHLQLQINPHFFLNSLNIIYNLATVKDFLHIQEMAKYLVTYFRFMFRGNSDFVVLRDELNHTENYLRIHQLRFPDSFSYRVAAPEELMSCQIPPLMIQTIVENCIKYAINLDTPIEITVNVERMYQPEFPDAAYITIQVRDTGPGFAKDVLQKLHTNVDLVNEKGEHIGLWNVKRRLGLLYMNRAVVEFANAPDGGAVVEIRLPANTISKGV